VRLLVTTAVFHPSFIPPNEIESIVGEYPLIVSYVSKFCFNESTSSVYNSVSPAPILSASGFQPVNPPTSLSVL